MRKRTLVIAWVFAVVLSLQSIMWLLAIPGTYAHTHRILWSLVLQTALVLLQVPLWVAVIRRKSWAWRPLVVTLGLALASAVVYLAYMTGYYLVHPAMLRNLPRDLAIYVGIALLSFVLPLWALLTDRPSGWVNPDRQGAL